MNSSYKPILTIAGMSCFLMALFQAAIGFSPSLSVYFGAPEILTRNPSALILVSLLISSILAAFGLYALSGVGFIRKLPFLKLILSLICGIFMLRGLILIPEVLVVMNLVESTIPIAPRFIYFSLGSLIIGIVFITGTRGGWDSFTKKGINDVTKNC